MAREMKDSGIEWIGEIPKGWSLIPVKYLASYNDEVLGDSTDKDYEFEYIEIGSVQYGRGIIKTEHFCFKDAPSRARRIVRKDDIIISTVRTYLKAVAAMPEFESPHIASTGFVVIRPHSISPQFLNYAVLSEAFISAIESNSVGISYPAINATDVVRLKIPVPDIAEQHRIASFLDRKCAEIDSVIANTQRTIEEYKALKQSIITEAVTKGVRGERPMKDSGIEWIGEIPVEWDVSKAKYLVQISHGTDPQTEGDIPVYGSGADSFKTCGEYKEGPCVLVGRKGATLHIPHYIEGRYWNVDTAFDVKSTELLELKLYYYLACSFDYKYYISQTTLPGMTQTNYNNMYLPVPPIREQTEIAAYLDENCAGIDRLIETKQKLLAELESYKKSVIYEYVTGKKEAPIS